MSDELSGGTPPSPSNTNSATGYAVLITFGLVAWGGYWLWTQADSRGYIPHDKLAAVSSESWAVGEYKDCFSLNIEMDQPVLSCDALLGSDKEKVFKVEFWGATYIEDMPRDAALRWKCTKTGDTDPAIKCEKR
jgi:hypothetical protein